MDFERLWWLWLREDEAVTRAECAGRMLKTQGGKRAIRRMRVATMPKTHIRASGNPVRRAPESSGAEAAGVSIRGALTTLSQLHDADAEEALLNSGRVSAGIRRRPRNGVGAALQNDGEIAGRIGRDHSGIHWRNGRHGAGANRVYRRDDAQPCIC
jgi:hypothetical protein